MKTGLSGPKTILIAIAWLIVYVFIGRYLQDNQIIEHPAWWSMYGGVMAVLFMMATLLFGRRV